MFWDWSYYFNKLKDWQFNINEEMFCFYFELSKVKVGVFGLVIKLYGIMFYKNLDILVYYKDVDVYEVLDKDGSFFVVLYMDFYLCEGKCFGVWMIEFKG